MYINGHTFFEEAVLKRLTEIEIVQREITRREEFDLVKCTPLL